MTGSYLSSSERIRMPRMSPIHYIDEGSPEHPPLVLLHSGGLSSQEWADHIKDFSRFFRVLVPDLPGHGRSPLRVKPLSIRNMAEAVLRMLDHCGVKRAHWVGSSMGGATALWATLNQPERVERLVLYRVSYRKNPEQFEETRKIADPERWIKLGLKRWLSRMHEAQGGPEAWRGVIARVAEAMDPKHGDHTHDLSELTRIQQQTLVIVGDRDPLVPLSQALDMVQALPHSALWVMPCATHITATNTWRREAFDAEVSRFLRRGIPKNPI